MAQSAKCCSQRGHGQGSCCDGCCGCSCCGGGEHWRTGPVCGNGQYWGGVGHNSGCNCCECDNGYNACAPCFRHSCTSYNINGGCYNCNRCGGCGRGACGGHGGGGGGHGGGCGVGCFAGDCCSANPMCRVVMKPIIKHVCNCSPFDCCEPYVPGCVDACVCKPAQCGENKLCFANACTGGSCCGRCNNFTCANAVNSATPSCSAGDLQCNADANQINSGIGFGSGGVNRADLHSCIFTTCQPVCSAHKTICVSAGNGRGTGSCCGHSCNFGRGGCGCFGRRGGCSGGGCGCGC